MWVFSSEFLENTTNFSTLFINSCSFCLYNCSFWIYSCVEFLDFFNIKINYFFNSNLLIDDSIDFFFQNFWYRINQISVFNLFWANLLNIYFSIFFFKDLFTSEWIKFFFNSREYSIFYLYHPEFFFFNFLFFLKTFANYNLELYLIIFENKFNESFFNFLFFYIFCMFFLFFNIIFLNYYFSYFNNFFREENLADINFVFVNLLFESEKEIGSFDDILLSLVFLIFIFGWYFYMYAWSVMTATSDITIIFFLFPFLYYVILSLPTYLIYNFGIFFVTYLRGSSTSSLLIMELMYDYIAFLAFYIRLLVQSVRLILMIFTYLSLHDLILFFDFDLKLFINIELIWEAFSNYFNSSSISYFFFNSFLIKIIYWLYELFHTFFVVTAQTIAFFAMVFWLFLFLYTFFVLEKLEFFFKDKRSRKFFLKYKI